VWTDRKGEEINYGDLVLTIIYSKVSVVIITGQTPSGNIAYIALSRFDADYGLPLRDFKTSWFVDVSERDKFLRVEADSLSEIETLSLNLLLKHNPWLNTLYDDRTRERTK